MSVGRRVAEAGKVTRALRIPLTPHSPRPQIVRAHVMGREVGGGGVATGEMERDWGPGKERGAGVHSLWQWEPW
jgi:hypothetical protein